MICIFYADHFASEQFQKRKEGGILVELDQFKAELNSYKEPLCEVRDSL